MAYSKKDWKDGEVITEAAMDNIEDGVAANDAKNTSQDERITNLEGKTRDATTETKGIVKQATKIDNVAAENAANATAANPTQAEFNKVVTLVNETKTKLNTALAALKAAGIMSGT